MIRKFFGAAASISIFLISLTIIDPMTAIRYQIVVMLMLVGATTLSSVTIMLLIRKKCFGSGEELLLTSS